MTLGAAARPSKEAPPKIAVVAHVGDTLGHLVRGVTLARALATRGARVVLLASDSARGWLATEAPDVVSRPIQWRFSHNDCDPVAPLPHYVSRVVGANRSLLQTLREEEPDVVVGMPGLVTVQAARHLGIAHRSVLHGPYLSPLVGESGFSAHERAVLRFATRVLTGGAVDAVFEALTERLGFPPLTYQTFLETELMYVPQPNLPLSARSNIREVAFIRGSFGPPADALDTRVDDACYVTFGSGNRCDITPVIESASRFFDDVLVSGGMRRIAPSDLPSNVSMVPAISSASLAPRVRAVVSHGGIGTVGTFGERGTPQLIIPTELDQATMAVHSARSDLATVIGLDSWRNRRELGRRMPPLTAAELSDAMDDLSAAPDRSPGVSATGAEEIAEDLVGAFGR